MSNYIFDLIVYIIILSLWHIHFLSLELETLVLNRWNSLFFLTIFITIFNYIYDTYTYFYHIFINRLWFSFVVFQLSPILYERIKICIHFLLFYNESKCWKWPCLKNHSLILYFVMFFEFSTLNYELSQHQF